MIVMTRFGPRVHTTWMSRLLARISLKALVATLILLASSGVLFPAAPALAASSSSVAAFSYFPETGHNLSGRFQTFYDHNGAQAVFGMPLTEVVAAGDLQVQYFERVRFELRQDSITLSLIGRAVTGGRTEVAFAWLTKSPTPDRTFYPESGHTLGGAFGWFWQSHGGLPIFGYPISEEFIEGERLVQYFERARLEYHPDQAGTPGEVQISPLGREYAQRQGVTPEQLAPTPPIVMLGEATIAIPSSAAHNVALATRRITGVEVEPGEILSFLRTTGEVSVTAGYEEGAAIVNGRVSANVGGGICYVSTALYRAAFLAGLEIVEHHPHSLALASFNDIPGFDAAVDTSGLDLRWRNDTPTPIIVAAELNAERGTLTVALWGQGDGRKTTMRDSTVQKGQTTVDTTISRVVVSTNRQVLHRDTVHSRYGIVNAGQRANKQVNR